MGLCASSRRNNVIDIKRKIPDDEEKKLTSQILCDSLSLAIVGNGEPPVENGQEFYQFLFTIDPRLQSHFVGADEFMGQDPKEPTKFAKQGQRLLMAIHTMAASFDDSEAFDKTVSDLIKRHKDRHVDPALWNKFFGWFVTFLKSKGELTSIEEDAWKQLGIRFNTVAQATLKTMGLPYEED
ncbi:hypothetical protein PRIPAC_97608 [Pristionchus pacificus]|uniref:GLOBIN domain-containing protein n=1 Tax=Pristionchus pacificus TaxID=54126 RepID=A0A454XVH3_PRIPA|nr:hypothetical protein PRIPAC_97608 [Pristionchus pacificus]|eukprot:PDM60336.1 hypothetical protein PRIPAC_54161 [Pristionchus pacificus]